MEIGTHWCIKYSSISQLPLWILNFSIYTLQAHDFFFLQKQCFQLFVLDLSKFTFFAYSFPFFVYFFLLYNVMHCLDLKYRICFNNSTAQHVSNHLWLDLSLKFLARIDCMSQSTPICYSQLNICQFILSIPQHIHSHTHTFCSTVISIIFDHCAKQWKSVLNHTQDFRCCCSFIQTHHKATDMSEKTLNHIVNTVENG